MAAVFSFWVTNFVGRFLFGIQGSIGCPLRLPLIDDLPKPLIVEVKDVFFGHFFGGRTNLFLF